MEGGERFPVSMSGKDLVSRIEKDPYKAANRKRQILSPTGKLAKDLNR